MGALEELDINGGQISKHTFNPSNRTSELLSVSGLIGDNGVDPKGVHAPPSRYRSLALWSGATCLEHDLPLENSADPS